MPICSCQIKCYTLFMLIVSAIFSVGLLGVIIYFAVSPKSSKLLKYSAIIALVLIGISLVICGIFLIKGPAEGSGIIPLAILPDAAPQVKRSFNVADILIIMAMLTVLVLVIIKALRDQKKAQKPQQQLKEAFDLPDEELEHKDPEFNDGEDSFDLDELDIK